MDAGDLDNRSLHNKGEERDDKGKSELSVWVGGWIEDLS
jgi:hypothetical protein